MLGEKLVAVPQAQLIEQQVTDQLASIAFVIVCFGGAKNRFQIHAGDLDRDQRILVFSNLDLADFSSPIPNLAQHHLGFLAGDGGPEGSMIERRQALRGQSLQGLDLRHQSGQQQRLQQARIIA